MRGGDDQDHGGGGAVRKKNPMVRRSLVEIFIEDGRLHLHIDPVMQPLELSSVVTMLSILRDQCRDLVEEHMADHPLGGDDEATP